VCAGNGTGGGGAAGSTTTSLAFARAGTSGAVGAARAVSIAARTGEHQVLAADKSQGPQHEQQQGGEGKDGAPSAVPRTTGAIPKPPAGNSPSELWVVAALAALAALAGASLVRRRFRFTPAVALPPEAVASGAAAGAAVAAAPVAPVDPSQQVVRDAFESLSAGDVEKAAALVHPDVRWPDPGNGAVEGREQFEQYWKSRLSTVSIDIEPLNFERRNGELMVEINEVVRSRMTRTTIGEYHAVRRFTFRDGLIAEMKHGRG
jgi:ketosteroid isomerase-like protein